MARSCTMANFTWFEWFIVLPLSGEKNKFDRIFNFNILW